MFSLYGGPAQLCDGLTRREILRAGGLSALGFFLPDLISLTHQPPRAAGSTLAADVATSSRARPAPRPARALAVAYLHVQRPLDSVATQKPIADCAPE